MKQFKALCILPEYAPFWKKTEAQDLDEAWNYFCQFCSLYNGKFQDLHEELPFNQIPLE